MLFPMARITQLFGVLLIVLGVGLWLATDRASMTALIPAFVGAFMLLLGFAATRAGTAKAALKGALLLALAITVAGFVRAGPSALKLLQGEDVANATAIWGQVAMAGIGLVYAVMALVRRPRGS